MMLKKLLWVYLGVVASMTAQSAEITPSEDTFLEDLPIVLSASRLSQSPLDASAPVTIIDRETIRASGFTEIHDIFRLVPGFLVADWPDGSPIVVNHGLGDAYSKRMQVLVDGRSVINPFHGGVDWQDLPLRLEDIERIEVVRAPNPSAYGANAFQGVINITTRSPLNDQGSGILVRAGQHDFSDLYAHFGKQGTDLSWRVSASKRTVPNFRDLALPVQYQDEIVHRDTMNAQMTYTPSPDQEWRFQFGLSQGGDDVGSAENASDGPRVRGEDTRFFQAAWHQTYAPASELSLQYYHYGYKQRERLDIYPVDPVLAPFPSLTYSRDLDVQRDDLEFQQIHAWSDRLRGLWGVGLRRDSANSPTLLYGLGDVTGWQWQLFGNVDWQANPDWRINFGGMLEEHYNTDTLFSPRLAVNYRLAPTQSLRFSTGKGYRAPTITEANAREVIAYDGGVADILHYAYKNLEPESVNYAELGYVGLAEPLGLRWDARLFINRYSNIIDSQSCIQDPETLAAYGTTLGLPCPFEPLPGYERPLGYSGKPWRYASIPFVLDAPPVPFAFNPRYGHYKAFYYFNSGRVQVHGADISLDWKSADWGRFRLSHAITQISASGVGWDVALNPNKVTKDADIEASAPQHSTSLLWSKPLPGKTDVSLGYYHVGGLKWPNDGDFQPAYVRIDLRLAKRFGTPAHPAEVALTLQSLNAEHTEFDDYLVERRAFLSLGLSW